jgi:hypothetical protein
MLAIVEITRNVHEGELTAQQRAALAARFGISEEVLLRYEHAVHAHRSSVFARQLEQAKLMAKLRLWRRGESANGPAFQRETERALCRIQEEMPEEEGTREIDEALAALMTALDAANETSSLLH